MKLTSHEEYGLRCLVEVARRGSDGSATIPEISRHEGISAPYVAKLLRILRRSGFVKAARGKVGGYTLALPPERICVGDALAALGGRIYQEDFCKRHSGTENLCVHSGDCSMRSLWRSVQDAIDGVLHATTLRDLVGPPNSAPPENELVGEFVALSDRERRASSTAAK